VFGSTSPIYGGGARRAEGAPTEVALTVFYYYPSATFGGPPSTANAVPLPSKEGRLGCWLNLPIYGGGGERSETEGVPAEVAPYRLVLIPQPLCGHPSTANAVPLPSKEGRLGCWLNLPIYGGGGERSETEGVPAEVAPYRLVLIPQPLCGHPSTANAVPLPSKEGRLGCWFNLPHLWGRWRAKRDGGGSR
jgi:prolipoprotein diacylglyceryltransferase